MRNLIIVGISIALAAACATYAAAQHVAYNAIQYKVSEIISAKKYISTTFWRTGILESVGYDHITMQTQRLDNPLGQGRTLRLEIDSSTQIVRQEFTEEGGVYTGIASLTPVAINELAPGTPITVLFDSSRPGHLKISLLYIGDAL